MESRSEEAILQQQVIDQQEEINGLKQTLNNIKNMFPALFAMGLTPNDVLSTPTSATPAKRSKRSREESKSLATESQSKKAKNSDHENDEKPSPRNQSPVEKLTLQNKLQNELFTALTQNMRLIDSSLQTHVQQQIAISEEIIASELSFFNLEKSQAESIFYLLAFSVCNRQNNQQIMSDFGHDRQALLLTMGNLMQVIEQLSQRLNGIVHLLNVSNREKSELKTNLTNSYREIETIQLQLQATKKEKKKPEALRSSKNSDASMLQTTQKNLELALKERDALKSEINVLKNNNLTFMRENTSLHNTLNQYWSRITTFNNTMQGQRNFNAIPPMNSMALSMPTPVPFPNSLPTHLPTYTLANSSNQNRLSTQPTAILNPSPSSETKSIAPSKDIKNSSPTALSQLTVFKPQAQPEAKTSEQKTYSSPSV